MRCDLSIIIPAYREAEHLCESVTRVVKIVETVTRDFEVIVIDDGSSDETWQRVLTLRERFAAVAGLRFSRNFGKDAAVSAGLAYCRGDAAIILDADLQFPPELIPVFYAKWRSEGVDLVEGVKRGRKDEPLVRRVFSRLFNRIATRYTGINFGDSCDFKLISRRVIDAWLTIQERRVFFRGIVAWLGFTRVQVPFDVEPRAGGKSKWGSIELGRLALHAIISFSSAPLRIAHVISASFFAFAVVLAARALMLKFQGAAVDGFTTVIILLLIIGGLLLGTLAIISEYLAAIYEELKARPRYIVSDTAGLQAANATSAGNLHLSSTR